MVLVIHDGVIGDHCRIGSLEIYGYSPETVKEDHCRIGSLETGNKT